MTKIKTPTVIQTEGIRKSRKIINYARTIEGLVDTDAYKGLEATIKVKNLNVNVIIDDARIRYGHLDLHVTPISGTGGMWIERKNIDIYADPGLSYPEENENITMPSFLAAPIKELVQQIIENEKSLTGS